MQDIDSYQHAELTPVLLAGVLAAGGQNHTGQQRNTVGRYGVG